METKDKPETEQAPEQVQSQEAAQTEPEAKESPVPVLGWRISEEGILEVRMDLVNSNVHTARGFLIFISETVKNWYRIVDESLARRQKHLVRADGGFMHKLRASEIGKKLFH